VAQERNYEIGAISRDLLDCPANGRENARNYEIGAI